MKVMAKFTEKFDELDWEPRWGECSCCKRPHPRTRAYKMGERMVLLCTHCDIFLREVLGE